MRGVNFKQISVFINPLINPLIFLFFLSIPFQFGPHFWPEFSIIDGIRVDYLSPTIYLSDICILFLFCISLLQRKITWKSIYYFFSSHFFLLFILFLLLFGVLLSENIGAGVYGIVKLFEFIFVGFFLANQFSLSMLRRLFVGALVIGLLFQSVLAIGQFTFQESIDGIFYFFGERSFTSQTIGIANTTLDGQLIVRPYGTFSHPNVLAGYILISLILLLYTSNIKKKMTSIWYLLVFLLGTTALILTLSRIVIILWFIVLVFSFRYFAKKKTLRLFSIFLLSSLILFSFLFPFRERFATLRISSESVHERYEQFKTSSRIIYDHPLFGVGLNNYFNHVRSYFVSYSYYHLQPVHNIYMLTFSEIGIIGLYFFGNFLFKTGKNVLVKIKQKKKQELIPFNTGLFLSFVSILVIGLFDHYFLTLQQGQLLLTSIVSIIWVKKT